MEKEQKELQGKIELDAEIKRKEQLFLSDVSCSYIDLIGDVALIRREKDRKWVEHNGLE